MSALEQIEEAANAIPPAATQSIVTKVHESLRDDPKLGFNHVGEYAMSVFKAHSPLHSGYVDRRLNLLAGVPSGLSQDDGSGAGFLVPPAFSREIWRDLQEGGDSLLGMTRTIPIGDAESITLPAVHETSRADGSRWGGAQGYWLAEADQLTKSKPKVRQIKLEPQQLAVLTWVTDKLLSNANALQAFITEAATSEINFKVGDAIVNGDGVGKPKGILNSGSVVSVAKVGSQTATTFWQTNAADMWARMHPRSQSRAVWLYNVDVMPQLLEMLLLVKNVAGTENVGGMGANLLNFNNGQFTLIGRPMFAVEYCATLGTAGDVILWDPGSYLTATQGTVTGESSIHLRFDYLETAFRWVFAVDGQSAIDSAITPFKGTNTLTNIVTVAVRA
jgi:HK97 family phage major capsid protein